MNASTSSQQCFGGIEFTLYVALSLSLSLQLSGSDPLPMSLPELSRIYPTPPSVETHNVDSSKFDEGKMVVEEGTEQNMACAASWENTNVS